MDKQFEQLCNDPYRILFPIAFINLLLGLGVWLPSLLLAGDSATVEHMQLMMQATMGCFVFGFLLTIFPKLWHSVHRGGTDRVQECEPTLPFFLLAAVSLCFLIQPFALFFDMRMMMTGSYSAAHVIVWLFIAVHIKKVLRSLNPFVLLVYIGFVSSTLCAVMPFLIDIMTIPVSMAIWVRHLNAQGTMLLLTAAVVPIILTRIRGGSPACGGGVAHARIKMLMLSLLSCAFIVSYYPFAWLITAPLMVLAIPRALFLALVFSHGIRLWRLPRGEHWFMWGVYFSLISILLGVVLPALCPPAMRTHLEHLIYISGFVMLILAISARIAGGHAGAKVIIENDKLGMGLIMGALCMSVLSRIGGFWSHTPEGANRHLIYAVVFIVLALVVWGIRYGKFLYVFPVAQKPAADPVADDTPT